MKKLLLTTLIFILFSILSSYALGTNLIHSTLLESNILDNSLPDRKELTNNVAKGDILILFDQSMSMNTYNPKSVSELVILTFINTFGLKNNIIFSGFAEHVVLYLSINTTEPTDIDRLRKSIADITLRSKVTDFEPALAYLVDYPKDVALAIIVTDGQPDIWDRGLKYLSQRVSNDPRYAPLNQQNEQQKSANISANVRHDKLNPAYEKRNMELINQHLNALKARYADRLIFMDIADKYQFLNDWAEIASAKQITVKTESTSKESLQQGLHQALSELQKIASQLLDEDLPHDYGNKIELTLNNETESHRIVMPDVMLEVTPKIILHCSPETIAEDILNLMQTMTSDIEKLEIIDQKKTEPRQLSAKNIETIKLSLCGLLLFIWLLYRVQQRLARQRQEPTFNLLDENLFVDSVHMQISSISASSMENAKKYIDNQIRLAVAEGNHYKLRLLHLEKLKYRFDKRISLRVKVAQGMIDIVYLDTSAQEQFAPVIDISLNALLFMKLGFEQEKIINIRINHPLEYLPISSYKIRKRDDSHFVLIFDDFDSKLDRRMRWVELITRLDEMSVTSSEKVL